MNKLDPFQLTFSGIHLIEASAGTGKTYNIASLYVRALIQEDREVAQILVVTYTEAATKELRDRLMTRLRESVQSLKGIKFGKDEFLQRLPQEIDDKEGAINKLEKAIHSFDEASIFTIHGFCRQVLQNRAFESRALFESELIGDDREIVEEMVADYWRTWVDEASQNATKKPLLSYILAKGYRPEKLSNELFRYIGKPYLTLLPHAANATGDVEARINALSDLYAKMRKSWEGEADHILTLLRADQMNGTKYRKKSIPDWIEEMDDWLRHEVVPIELFKKFEKFTQSTINESINKTSDEPPPAHIFFEQAEAYQSFAKALQQVDVYFKRELFEYLQQHIGAKKEQLKVFSFDDLLIKLRNALQGDSGPALRQTLRAAYPIALVDEFQDTDPIQYQIFKMIYASDEKGGALFMIGDPKQSIYSFRGADIFTYLKAQKDAPKDKVYSLDRNFRSVPPLIEAVNKLFGQHDNPFILEKIVFNEVKPGKKEYEQLKIDGKIATPFDIRILGKADDKVPLTKGIAEERSAADTANQIYHLLKQADEQQATIGEAKVEAGDIAVLVRSHHQAEIISEALKEKGIKSVRYSQQSVFKSEEAEAFYYVLKAIAEPTNEGLVKAALATSFMGYTAAELFGFEEDEQLWIHKLEQFADWHNRWQQQGLAAMFRYIMHEEHVAEKIIGLKNGERKLTNFIHLAELVQNREQQGKAGMQSLLHWYAHKRKEAPKDADDEQLRLESDEHLVKVVTMHRSKGLEYPIVFCPFLWKGPEFTDEGIPITFHDTDNESVYLDFNGKDDPERSQKRLQMAIEDVAESVRLAYVAITRAKYKSSISWVQASKTEFSPLGYLLLGKAECFNILKNAISPDGKYKAVDSSAFEEAYTRIFKPHPQLFAIKNAAHASTKQQLSLPMEQATLMESRTFMRQSLLKAGHHIGSFSSLVRNENEAFDTDYLSYFDEPYHQEPEEHEEQEKSIFSFPKGPNPGTAIHHIFEDIDFNHSKTWHDVIAQHLSRQSISQKWSPVVQRMLKNTLSKKLLSDKTELSLQNISPRNFIAELEFYFTSRGLHLDELLQIIRPEGPIAPSADGFSEEGFLKGFIDLTFKFGNRYYILDYKTNHLGDTVENYTREALHEEIHEAFYDVQYHIYTVALHRFLAGRLKDYTYESYFGGVFYLFLRGINPEGSEGIFFDRPDASCINKLNDYMSRGPA